MIPLSCMFLFSVGPGMSRARLEELSRPRIRSCSEPDIQVWDDIERPLWGVSKQSLNATYVRFPSLPQFHRKYPILFTELSFMTLCTLNISSLKVSHQESSFWLNPVSCTLPQTDLVILVTHTCSLI